jgi:hypothetical protein
VAASMARRTAAPLRCCRSWRTVVGRGEESRPASSPQHPVVVVHFEEAPQETDLVAAAAVAAVVTVAAAASVVGPSRQVAEGAFFPAPL